MLYEIKTWAAITKPGWLLISTGGRLYLIPEHEFHKLVIEAGLKFRTVAPIAPYSEYIWVTWKTNKRIYTWFVKQLEKVQEKYKSYLGLDRELELEEDID